MERVGGGTGGIGAGALKGVDDFQRGERCDRGQDDHAGAQLGKQLSRVTEP
ncbi:hypothetical protein OG693_04075 [Streptomyces sp. NBC_01259]|uniref:hypothetical protein n=1 Tax=Streptomyces sp. NBC_01259 TaxID=2903800 RepID=UPI003249FD9A